MNLPETQYWLNQVFPVELETVELEDIARDTPGHGSAGQAGTGRAHIMGAELDDGSGETLACTANAASLDSGLVADGEPFEVRSEIFAVARVSQGSLARALSTIVDRLGADEQVAQPGSVLENIVGDDDLDDKWTVRHALFIAPYVWGPESPQMREQPGDVHGPGHTDPSLGRLTVLLQVIMLTDNERDYLHEHGVAALQAELGTREADLLDWRRR